MSVFIAINRILVVLLFIRNTVIGDGISKSATNLEEKGNCTCGGFSTAIITSDNEPLLSQAPGLMVKCNEEGETACKSLCIALANVTKAKGPEILCNRLKDANDLKMSAFFKVCENPWMYAGMTADEPLCCDNTKVKTCASSLKENATVVVDAKTVM